MKKLMFPILLVAVFAISLSAQPAGQTPVANTLASQTVEQFGKDMDVAIVEWNKRIAGVIEKYDLLNTRDIRILPYQSNYDLGDGYIEIERHTFIKDPAGRRTAFGYKQIQGIVLKRIKIYTDGKNISKIETDVQEKFFNDRPINRIIIVDSSPTTDGTDNITFTHIHKGRTLVDNKKLADIKNQADSPIRNNLKRDFLIPNLNLCYYALSFIGEAYYSSLRDGDRYMENILKNAISGE
ncbi:MAG: hypothetical protein FWG92_02685 [Leptospirales bacterium]|nr:hypothetical protein [Leptospirales bacterium]